mgnify:FL=1
MMTQHTQRVRLQLARTLLEQARIELAVQERWLSERDTDARAGNGSIRRCLEEAQRAVEDLLKDIASTREGA